MSDKNGSEGRIQWSRFFKKLSPYMIQKGLLYLKHYGPREFWIRLHERFEPEEFTKTPGGILNWWLFIRPPSDSQNSRYLNLLFCFTEIKVTAIFHSHVYLIQYIFG